MELTTTTTEPNTRQVSFSSPALEQAPALASVLDKLTRADALAVQAVVELVGLFADGTDDVAQVGIEQWVGIVARQTRMDRRLLLRLCRRLHRYPQLVAAAAVGRVSFAQLRGIWLRIRDASPALDPAIDARIGAVCTELGGDVDPDVLLEQVERVIRTCATDELAAQERSAERSRFLYLQPTLDGTGGRISGFYDAAGLALLDEATAPRPNQLGDERTIGQLRADNLLEWLAHSCTGSGACSCEGTGTTSPLTSDAGGDTSTPKDRAGPAAGKRTSLARPDGTMPTPKLLVRIGLDSLLDRDRLPATLLTRLVGGRLWMTSDAARRLADQRGAELRSVFVDDTGKVVGIGRASRVPPGWIGDATLALHDTCTEPCCDRPARGAQADHAVAWWPASRDDPYGTTDIGNIGPLCPTTNPTKEADGWRATQTADGIRRWMHLASGLQVTTVPATWEPRGLDPPEDAPPADALPADRPPDAGPAGPSSPP